MNEKKNSGVLVAFLIIFIFISVCLAGYIVYDKIILKDNQNNISSEQSKEEVQEEEKEEFAAYNIGDQVAVQLNDSDTETFYVLKQSSTTEEFVTLFAPKNIGTSAFNNDLTDGNEYHGSLIESKLNELTTSWTNVKEKRLITVDEIVATGLTSKQQCGPSENDVCDFINEDSWLNSNEIYWTMTKATNDERYVYHVGSGGAIDIHIVGYEPGGKWNENGTLFANFGIRPVIKISKNYVRMQ